MTCYYCDKEIPETVPDAELRDFQANRFEVATAHKACYELEHVTTILDDGWDE